jgi:hypothetical protein
LITVLMKSRSSEMLDSFFWYLAGVRIITTRRSLILLLC